MRHRRRPEVPFLLALALALACGSWLLAAEIGTEGTGAGRDTIQASLATTILSVLFPPEGAEPAGEASASPFVPPGRPEDRPPEDPGPGNPPGKPEDRPPSSVPGHGSDLPNE